MSIKKNSLPKTLTRSAREARTYVSAHKNAAVGVAAAFAAVTAGVAYYFIKKSNA